MIEYILSILIVTGVLFGQLGRLELGDRLVNIYIHEIGMMLWLMYQIVKYKLSSVRGGLLQNPAVFYFTAWMFIGFVATSPQFSLTQNIISFLYPLRFLLYLLFSTSFIYWVERSEHNKNISFHILYTFTIMLVGVSLLQYIFVKDLWSMYPYGWDPHQFRVFATYLDVYVAAAVLGLLTLFWLHQKNFILVGGLLICLALTFSRSAYIALFMAILVYSFVHKKYKIATIVAAIFIALVFITPKNWGEGVNLLRTSTIQSRIADTQLGIRIWKAAPIEGHGYNHLRYVKEQMNLLHLDDRSHSASSFHSSYLIILASTGVIGLGLFLWSLYSIFHKKQVMVYGVFLSVMSVFDNVLLYGMVAIIALFVVVLSRPLRKSQ